MGGHWGGIEGDDIESIFEDQDVQKVLDAFKNDEEEEHEVTFTERDLRFTYKANKSPEPGAIVVRGNADKEILPGMSLFKVNDEEVNELPYEDIVDKINGVKAKADSTHPFTITFLDDGPETYSWWRFFFRVLIL